MKLLVLGGTQFVGRAVVTAALAAGDEVTLLHRGQTNPDLFAEAEHLLGDRDGGLAVLGDRSWDACIDTCGYVPRVVRDAAEHLRDRVGRYVFVSTISVYSDLSVPRDESGPLLEIDDPSSEQVEQHYGALKVLCEEVVRDTFGAGAAIVRPGFVVGPHDHTGRFTWWVHRGAAGGEIPVPASLAHRIQVIDARDLGEFLGHVARDGLEGTVNATGPFPPISMLDVLAAAAAATGRRVDPVVIDDDFLTERGLEFTDLPLWLGGADWAAWAEIDIRRALAAGLGFRKLEDTIDATLFHAATTDTMGLTPAREAELLGAWRSRM